LCRAWKSQDFEKHYVLKKGVNSFVIMNTYPYNNGHLMVASAAHKGDFEDIGIEVRSEIMELVSDSIGVLKEAISPHGFNVGINLGQVAGAGLTDHLHVHILPRWQGDTNYMPLLADVKVISEHLDDTYRKIVDRFNK
jgi:ATP adenylyltransferase